LANGRGGASDLIPGEIGATARSRAAAGLLQRGAGLVAIVAGFVAVAIVAGALIVTRQERQLRAKALGYVGAVAEFRSSELERWLAERRGDAQVMARDPRIAAALAEPDAARVRAAEQRLALIARSYAYRAIAALDVDGARRFGVGDARLTEETAGRARAAISSGQLQSPGLRWLEGTADTLTLDVVTPVFADAGDAARVDPGSASRCVGALVLRFDPTEVVTGILGIPPAASESGTMSLLVHDGGNPFYLYPKLRGTGATWISRRPPAPFMSSEAQVARGSADLSTSVDENGDAVIATARPLPGFDGVVVGHIRETEMFGPSARATWLTIVLVASLLLGVALLARGRWAQSTREALRAKEAKFKLIFENMQDAYMLSRLDGTILLVNPALVRMLGYERESDLVGKNAGRDVFLDEAERTALKAKLAEVGQAVGYKTTFKRADGSPLIVEGNVHLVRDERGAPVGVEGVIRDMTTHYQIRADLVAAREAAEVAARGKSQFLANVSHEIRTPLNAIVGLGHLLLSAELPARQRDYVAKIHSSARILLRTVDDVLDFSKIEAGKLELERTPFRLDEVLEDLVSVLAVQADGKGISFVVTVGADVPRSLIGDPLRLGQVLTNLIGNAIKFTEVGGVTLKVALGGRDETDARLRFAVEDTGIGVTAPQLAKIFQPFTQADGSTTRRFGGTGLGLAICRQVVEAMGGRLEAASVPGSGSTFAFEVAFRVSAAEVQSASPAAAPAARSGDGPREGFVSTPPLRLRGARVLLVEDNIINQQVARELLEAAGVTVSIADNGRAAVDVVGVSGGALDAVLMDVQMPGMDGVSAARAIRAVPAHAGLPIIAMTAHAEVTERERCLAAGMNDYVSKPFEPAHLFKTLARWLKDRDRGGSADDLRPRA
jgi:PAS domain S-box-containing protein